MATFADLAVGRRGVRSGIVDRYVQGIQIGLEESAQDELANFRMAETGKIIADMQRRRRISSPEVMGAISTLSDITLDPKDDRVREALTTVYSTGDDQTIRQVNDLRNGLLKWKQQTDLASSEELADMISAYAIEGATPEQFEGMTRPEALKAMGQRAISQRQEKTLAQGERRIDIAAQNAATSRLNAESNRLSAEGLAERRDVMNQMTQLQIGQLEGKIGRGGFADETDFADWAVPYFLTIMTNGRTARRGEDVPEAAAAEGASHAAWTLVQQGVPYGDAVSQIMARYKIGPKQKRPLRPDVRTRPEDIISDITNPPARAATPESTRAAVVRALSEILTQEQE